MTDTEILNWLDSLGKRTARINGRVGIEPVRSEVHIKGEMFAVILRNEYGEPIAHGQGGTIREAVLATAGQYDSYTPPSGRSQ